MLVGYGFPRFPHSTGRGRCQAPDGGPALMASRFRCDRSAFKRNLREVSESAFAGGADNGPPARLGKAFPCPRPAGPFKLDSRRLTRHGSRPGGFLETLLPVGPYRVRLSLRISSSVYRACWVSRRTSPITSLISRNGSLLRLACSATSCTDCIMCIGPIMIHCGTGLRGGSRGGLS